MPHVDLARACATERSHLALLQRAQQLGQQRRRGLADLVEKEHAAVGRFEEAGLFAIRSHRRSGCGHRLHDGPPRRARRDVHAFAACARGGAAGTCGCRWRARRCGCNRCRACRPARSRGRGVAPAPLAPWIEMASAWARLRRLGPIARMPETPPALVAAAGATRKPSTVLGVRAYALYSRALSDIRESR